jgi:hypothetical protein
MATMTQELPRLKRLNWWKIGFFCALLAFEVTREIAVIEAAGGPTVSVLATVTSFNGWTTAQGSWRRIDGGGKLVPVAVRIECDRERGQCTEATVNVFDNSVSAPVVERFDARFTPDAISYENNSPICVHYSTRIDLRLEKVISVRQRTADKSEICNTMEQRVEMQLADGWDSTDDGLKGHFVPVLSLLRALLQLF